MTKTQNAPSTTGFPTPSAALRFGWSFFKANFWMVLVIGVISGILVGFTVGWCMDTYQDSPSGAGPWLVAAAVVAIDVVIQAFLRLVLCRRAFDYRQESEGQVASRSFSVGFRHAVHGAMPRLFPYLGWSVFQLSVVALVFLLWFVIGDAAPDGIGIIVLLGLLVAIFAVELFTAFYDLAAADGPGNPLTRSAEVFKGHFWGVVKVIVAFVLLDLAIAIPISLVVMAVAGDSFGDATSAVANSSIYAIVASGIGVGTRVSMYRAVVPARASS